MNARLWSFLLAGAIAGCQVIAGISDDLPGTPAGPGGGTAGLAGSASVATTGMSGAGGHGGGAPDASAGASGSGGSNAGSGGAAGAPDASAGGSGGGGGASAGGSAGASAGGSAGTGGSGGASAGAGGTAGASAGGNAGASGSAGASGAGGRGGASGSGGSGGNAGTVGGSSGSAGSGPVDAGPSCTDLQRNGDESDVDCGGSCPKCATGRRCNAPADCQGAFCNNNKCGVCSSGSKGCAGNAPQTCTVDGAWMVGPACASPTPMCTMGQCVTPSCQAAGTGAGPNCGPTGMDNCCDSPYVLGGMFSRSFDGITYTDPSAVATVGDFRMDRYEITVGRFRAFLNAYPGSRPAAGAGQHPALGAASGWQAAWDGNLPSTIGMYQAALKCGGFQMWTDSPGANEKKPMNCLSWYDAFAFCAWDGGRLATEAEWNYVAAFGNGACPYPWSTCLPINTTYAVYDCTGDGSIGTSQGGTCTANDILAVGSRSPTGDARWSQSDISGNLNEWTLDTYASYIIPCNNCANLTNGTSKVYRGGNFIGTPHDLLSGTRFNITPTHRDPGIGARCVRAP